jgi:hypothetical protein
MGMAEHQEQLEVIARFADGERVDAKALREALGHEAGRDYLIDLVAMREITRLVDGRALATATDTDILAPVTDDRMPWASTSTRTPWHRGRLLAPLAAALVLMVGIAGYAIGQQRSTVVPVSVLPPLEADVMIAVEIPPAPTQVIRLGSVRSDGGGR